MAVLHSLTFVALSWKSVNGTNWMRFCSKIYISSWRREKLATDQSCRVRMIVTCGKLNAYWMSRRRERMFLFVSIKYPYISICNTFVCWSFVQLTLAEFQLCFFLFLFFIFKCSIANSHFGVKLCFIILFFPCPYTHTLLSSSVTPIQTRSNYFIDVFFSFSVWWSCRFVLSILVAFVYISYQLNEFFVYYYLSKLIGFVLFLLATNCERTDTTISDIFIIKNKFNEFQIVWWNSAPKNRRNLHCLTSLHWIVDITPWWVVLETSIRIIFF